MSCQVEVQAEVGNNTYYNGYFKKKRSRSPDFGEMSPLHPSDVDDTDFYSSSFSSSNNKITTNETIDTQKRAKTLNNDTKENNISLTKAEIKLMEQAIQDIKDGKFIVVVDDESRENEGDLILAAEKATTEKIAFMVNETSGVICIPCTDSRLKELQFPQMVEVNTENHQTAFTVTVDYKIGTTTGISASDRAATFRAIADPKTKASDFARPGHVFPLRAKSGGVLERPGHTETAVDLCRYAGLFPAGVISELVNKDGSMKRLPELKIFAQEHSLTLVSVDQLKRYRQLVPFPLNKT